MRSLLLVYVLAIVVACVVVSCRDDAQSFSPSPDPAPVRCDDARRGLAFYARRFVEWHAQMGVRRAKPAARPHPCKLTRQLAKRWRLRSAVARLTFESWHRRTYAKWRCVHRGEGHWHSNTGNGYYGGLQFDATFERTYSPEFVRRWGHAHRWPVWAQLVTAERGWRDRGWHPWPNTARACGLL